MRLKILFFPLILIISSSLAIGYIVPLYSTIQLDKNELEETRAKKETLSEKKTNIENAIKKLNSSTTDYDYLLAFISPQRDEERIINSINFLAERSLINIVDMSLENGPVVTPEQAAQQLTALGAYKDQNVTGKPQISLDKLKISKLRTMQLSVSVSGRYEEIKSFLERLERMEMHSSIVDFRMLAYKPEKEGASTDILQADIGVDFTYMPESQNAKNLVNAVPDNPDQDFNAIAGMHEFTKYDLPAIEIGKRGSINPFAMTSSAVPPQGESNTEALATEN